ncbi:hypothetical protein KAR91_74180 [Candidatus Pacearchaeota archaeon]|nr:hypothetical protein [Candidatus Pacearchaeota archaeon]
MGRRSWVVKTDKKHTEDVIKASKEFGDIFAVGAGLIKEPLKDIDKGTYFKPGDVVLLLQSDGSYVITEFPEIFNREFCCLDNIHTTMTDKGGKIEELEYLDKEKFDTLI